MASVSGQTMWLINCQSQIKYSSLYCLPSSHCVCICVCVCVCVLLLTRVYVCIYMYTYMYKARPQSTVYRGRTLQRFVHIISAISWWEFSWYHFYFKSYSTLDRVQTAGDAIRVALRASRNKWHLINLLKVANKNILEKIDNNIAMVRQPFCWFRTQQIFAK